MKKDVGLFIGRFQPFHLGHYSVIKKIEKDDMKKLIIAIGSSQYSNNFSNPFDVNERIEMIGVTLKNEKLNYKLIPIKDFNHNIEWMKYIEKKFPKFDIVYTNSELTETLFKQANYKVINTPMKLFEGRPISGEMIRHMIVRNDSRWKKLVPKSVYKKILEFNGVKRIKKYFKKT